MKKILALLLIVGFLIGISATLEEIGEESSLSDHADFSDSGDTGDTSGGSSRCGGGNGNGGGAPD